MDSSGFADRFSAQKLKGDDKLVSLLINVVNNRSEQVIKAGDYSGWPKVDVTISLNGNKLVRDPPQQKPGWFSSTNSRSEFLQTQIDNYNNSSDKASVLSGWNSRLQKNAAIKKRQADLKSITSVERQAVINKEKEDTMQGRLTAMNITPMTKEQRDEYSKKARERNELDQMRRDRKIQSQGLSSGVSTTHASLTSANPIKKGGKRTHKIQRRKRRAKSYKHKKAKQTKKSRKRKTHHRRSTRRR